MVELWDVAEERLVWKENVGGCGAIRESCFDFHPQTMRFVSKDKGDIRIWDVGSDQPPLTFFAHTLDILAITFSHDGKIIASIACDRQVKLWDAATGKYLMNLSTIPFYLLDGDDYTLERLLFSPDDRQIICSSIGGTTVVWAYPPLQQLIDETRRRYENRPLTTEERQQYYIE